MEKSLTQAFHGSPSNALIDRNFVDQVLAVGNNLILWTTVRHDTLNECVVAGANRYFSPKKSGIYHMALQVAFASLAVGQSLTIFILTTVWGTISRTLIPVTAALQYTLNLAIDRYLRAGELVTCYASINNIASAPVIDGDSDYTYFSVHRVR